MVNTRRGKEGFTMVELAIVLVVIGLIVTMAFKGKQLIDSAKVKNAAAQYNKIVSALNMFYERYGFYPGDGCTTATPASPAACTGAKDGFISSSENAAAWYLLIDVTGMLSQSDRMSVFGQPWNFSHIATNNTVTGTNLSLPAGSQADSRLVCQLDKLIDDGVNSTGILTSNVTYSQNTDCWSLTTTATNLAIRVLP